MKYARDKKTGFPCVLFGKHYVSLMPLAKVQVEQYIWSGARADDSRQLAGQRAVQDQDAFLELLRPEALEAGCDGLVGGRYRFDQKVHWLPGRGARSINLLLRRQPLGTPRTEEAVLATNLAHCAYDYEYGEDAPVPQAWSPIDRILRWLEARNPQEEHDGLGPLPTLDEYDGFVEEFGSRSSRQLIKDVLNSPVGLSRAARRILDVFVTKKRFADEQGLIFLERGIWELTADKASRHVFAGRKPGAAWKPMAVGASRFLPSLQPPRAGLGKRPDRHLVLIEHHPAIGYRPMFPPEAVTSLEDELHE